MPGGLETKVQGFVHTLEQGFLAKVIRWAAFVVALVALVIVYLFLNFKGLSAREGMEQAQIARALASGDGFSTKTIRPIAIWQFTDNDRDIPKVNFPDTFHAPLNPAINAVPLWLARSKWSMSTRDVIYFPDRIIAAVAVGFFVLALGVNFLIARRLFDIKIALLGTGLLVLCDLFWKFSLSGLPQMLMLFLFSLANYCLVRAIEARNEGAAVGIWLAAVGFVFGLLALTNALTIWMLVGAVIFVAIYFQPRGISAVLVLGFFTIVYAPWLVRTYAVSGNPTGIALYSAMGGVKGSSDQWMRSMNPDVSDVKPQWFRQKLQNGIVKQINDLLGYLGWSLVAPVFFLSLLHSFRGAARSHFRWFILPVWMAAGAGMALFGVEEVVSANQLHVLFIPAMTFYGLAFLLVLWSRLPIDYRAIRIAFLTVIFAICAIPLAIQILPGGGKGRLNWPPYVPPFIAILRQWIEPQEVVASDMPWAVAWYANRKSLWIPTTPQDMVNLHDYNTLGGSIPALYLTPITGHKGLFNDILKGEYEEWRQLILRAGTPAGFPLTAVVPLPIDNECVLYADRPRWQATNLTEAAESNPATEKEKEKDEE